MICNNCNSLNPDDSKYCNECGSALTLSTEPTVASKENKSSQKSYNTLRVLNWILSIFLLGGIAKSLFSVQEISPLVVIMLVLFILMIANYVGTAIALNPEVTIIMGAPISLNASNKIALIALLVGNGILCLSSLTTIVASLSTSQYGPSIFGFLFLIFTLGNIRALWEIKKSNKEYYR